MWFEIKLQINLNLYFKIWFGKLEKKKRKDFSPSPSLFGLLAQPLGLTHPQLSRRPRLPSLSLTARPGFHVGPASVPAPRGLAQRKPRRALSSLACLADMPGPHVRVIPFLQLMSGTDTTAADDSAPPTSSPLSCVPSCSRPLNSAPALRRPHLTLKHQPPPSYCSSRHSPRQQLFDNYTEMHV